MIAARAHPPGRLAIHVSDIEAAALYLAARHANGSLGYTQSCPEDTSAHSTLPQSTIPRKKVINNASRQ